MARESSPAKALDGAYLDHGLTNLELWTLREVVELVPDSLPEGEGVTVEEVAPHLAEQLDALLKLRSPVWERFQLDLTQEQLRNFQLEMIFKRLGDAGYLDWQWGGGWGYAQPTVAGRALIRRLDRGALGALWARDFLAAALSNAVGSVLATLILLLAGAFITFALAVVISHLHH